MLQVTMYVLACSMVLTPVMSGNPSPVPSIVNGLKYQCQARGDYVGACTTQNTASGGFQCRRLACAKLMPNGVHEAVYTGPVLDYTECAKNKVCRNGKCEFAGPKGVPPQLGPGPQYKCGEPTIPTLVVPPQVRNPSQGPSGQQSRKTGISSPAKLENKRRRTQ